MAKKGELTAKQQRFVDEYAVDLNATQAAIRAGYSVKTAGAIATENLAKPLIAVAIAAKAKKVSNKVELTAEGVIRNLQRVHEMAVDSGQLSAANKSLELQGKFLGIWIDKHVVDVGPTLAELLERDE